jgi:hypothetical protein
VFTTTAAASAESVQKQLKNREPPSSLVDAKTKKKVNGLPAVSVNETNTGDSTPLSLFSNRWSMKRQLAQLKVDQTDSISTSAHCFLPAVSDAHNRKRTFLSPQPAEAKSDASKRVMRGDSLTGCNENLMSELVKLETRCISVPYPRQKVFQKSMESDSVTKSKLRQRPVVVDDKVLAVGTVGLTLTRCRRHCSRKVFLRPRQLQQRPRRRGSKALIEPSTVAKPTEIAVGVQVQANSVMQANESKKAFATFDAAVVHYSQSERRKAIVKRLRYFTAYRRNSKFLQTLAHL